MPHTTPLSLSVDVVRTALGSVKYPGLTRDIVSFGMVHHITVCDGIVKVQLALRSPDDATVAILRHEITEQLLPLGATIVNVEVTAPAPAPLPTASSKQDPWAGQVRLGRVQHVVAVGAGKGGVGKSTVAVNLAMSLAAEGLRVGLLDADIYGPSLPILLGVDDGASRARMTEDGAIVPLSAHGIPFVSFGFFLGEGSPAVWRGPMVSKAVKQFARGVAWPELDILIVDLPPGTGDIPLSLAQAVVLSGAVVVTQPARVAAAEARKAIEMFRTLEVPVLGVVENMAGAFGGSAGKEVSAELGVPFLGTLQFDPEMVHEGDAGTPSRMQRPQSDNACAFDRIAEVIAGALGWNHVEAVTR